MITKYSNKIKFSLLILLILNLNLVYSNNNAFQKLCAVNKCWLEQKDVDTAALMQVNLLNERDWIKFHLMKVEKILRKRSTEHLSLAQKLNRLNCLNELYSYWQAEIFRINDAYAFRTPIFIDKYNNFCAVGYLIKASGHEDISRLIASKNNTAYVKQMHYPELERWANDNGFTLDELAWIQPSYPEPISPLLPLLSNGFDKGPKCMAIDSVNHKLYVGGDFDLMGGNQPAYGIAVYDIDSNKWGTTTPSAYIGVNAMQVYHDTLFLCKPPVNPILLLS